MELMEKFCVCVCCAAITMLILVVVCDITRQRCGKCDKCKGVNKMERLTRPTVEVDETAAKYMGSFPVDIRTYKDRLLELILNGPTLNGVSKDALRQIIRQLYGRLKEYEDGRTEPCDYCDGSQKPLPVYVYADIPYSSFNRIRIESDGAFLEDADGNDIRIKACPMCGRSLEEGAVDSNG